MANRIFPGILFYPDKYSYLVEMLKNAVFRKRRDVESDPAYKQVIPYVILVHQTYVFSYRLGQTPE